MYKLKYIDKIGEDKGNVYTAFGKIIHDKCQSFFTTKEMNIELTLKEIKECLDGEMPKANPECDYCNYRKAVNEVEEK